MRNVIVVGLLALLAMSANGCSSSSSAQSPPMPVVLNMSTLAIVDVTPFQNGWVYFRSDSIALGSEPWFSDGTEANTYVLADISPGPTDSECSRILSGSDTTAASAGFVYFYADDGVHGCEVWRTDGTPEGTELFAELYPGPEGIQTMGDMKVSGSELYVAVGRPGSSLMMDLHAVNLN